MEQGGVTIKRQEGKKILVCLSGARDIELTSGKKVNTGFFLNELMVPVLKLLDSGYEIVFANPSGATPCMDPISDNFAWFGIKYNDYKRCKSYIINQMTAASTPPGALRTPRVFSSFTDEELSTFAGVFVPGGHAPMNDLWKDSCLGKILMFFHTNNKPTAAICHGPVALLSTKLSNNGNFAYSGYNMTCYSNNEEMINETMWMSKLSFKVENVLRDHGGLLNIRMPMLPNTVVDRELITGQGPTSAWRLATQFLEMLSSFSRGDPQLWAHTHSAQTSTGSSISSTAPAPVVTGLTGKQGPSISTPTGEVGQRMQGEGVHASTEHSTEQTTHTISQAAPQSSV